jgi:phosphoribosylformylglycinamidine cyclo-ligase
MPSVMRVLGALGGIPAPELRATFNAGLGMILVVPAAAAARTVELSVARGVPAWIVGEVVEAAAIGGRYIEEGLTR